MGDSYRDYLKGRKRFGYRTGQEADRSSAVEARAKAIREKNRKIKAQGLQWAKRLDGV